MSERFGCQYCNKTFARESTLSVHVCVGKQRALAKSESHVRIAFEAFNRFHKYNQGSNRDKTYDEFAKSKFYTGFVKFGSFVNNVKPLYPDKYIEYVIKNSVALDQWCNETVYEKYVLALIKTEPIESALERAVIHMNKWGEKTGNNWNDYFRNVSLNRAIYDIKDGKISPWLILNSSNGKRMLSQLDDSQLAYLGKILDPTFWPIKFQRQASDTSLVLSIIENGDL